MKDKRTTLGFVPAKFRIFVIRMRSMFVLLNADEMVNPPIRSIMVGENICENTYLACCGCGSFRSAFKRGQRLWRGGEELLSHSRL